MPQLALTLFPCSGRLPGCGRLKWRPCWPTKYRVTGRGKVGSPVLRRSPRRAPSALVRRAGVPQGDSSKWHSRSLVQHHASQLISAEGGKKCRNSLGRSLLSAGWHCSLLAVTTSPSRLRLSRRRPRSPRSTSFRRSSRSRSVRRSFSRPRSR